MKFEAKPKLNGCKKRLFPTIQEALKYLEEQTGYQMAADDWKLIGKLNILKEA